MKIRRISVALPSFNEAKINAQTVRTIVL